MFGIKFDAAESAANNLRQAISDLRKQRDQLNQQLEAHEAERETLYLQPVSKADAKQFLFDYIDAWAAQWLNANGLDRLFGILAQPKRDAAFAKLHNLTSPHLTLLDVETVMARSIPAAGQVFGVEPLPVFGGALTGMNDTYIGGACFFFGDVLKAKMGEYFDQKYSEHMAGVAGLPVAERRQSIAVLDGQISELLAAVKMIDGKLNELGFKEITPIRVKEVDDPKYGKRLVRA